MMKKRWQDYLTVRCLCLTVLFWGVIKSLSVLLSFWGLEYRSWVQDTLFLLHFVTLLASLSCFLVDVWRSQRFSLFWKWLISVPTAFACALLLLMTCFAVLLTLAGTGYTIKNGLEVTFSEIGDGTSYLGVSRSYHQIRGPFLREIVPVKEETIY